MPPVGFEPTIAVDERPKTYALDRAATETGTASSSKFNTESTMPPLPIRLHGVHKDNLYFTCFMTPWPH